MKVKKLSGRATLPQRGSSGAVGYDLFSATNTIVPAQNRALIPTDLSMSFPDGVYGRIAPRSGLAWKHGIDVGGGVIDPDYRGNVQVVLFNHSPTPFTVKAGDRVAQLILERCAIVEVEEMKELSETIRGEKGFGSTGGFETGVFAVTETSGEAETGARTDVLASSKCRPRQKSQKRSRDGDCETEGHVALHK